MDLNKIKKYIYSQKTKLAPSKIKGAGIGLFALVDIPKDTLLSGHKEFMQFINEKEDCMFDWAEFSDLDERIKNYLHSMTDGHDSKFYIDAPPFMLYQCYYLNHSDKPNCFWDRRTGDIFTQVDVSAGDELTMYYMPEERDFQ